MLPAGAGVIVRRQILSCGMWLALDSAERLVYVALWLRCDGRFECYPSLARIAADTGLGRTRVGKAIKKMCMLGIVRKSERRPTHTVVYRVRDLETLYGGGDDKRGKAS